MNSFTVTSMEICRPFKTTIEIPDDTKCPITQSTMKELREAQLGAKPPRPHILALAKDCLSQNCAVFNGVDLKQWLSAQFTNPNTRAKCEAVFYFAVKNVTKGYEYIGSETEKKPNLLVKNYINASSLEKSEDTRQARIALANQQGISDQDKRYWLELIVADDPKDAHAHNALADTLYGLGELLEVKKHLTIAVSLEPKNAQYNFNLAWALRLIGEFQEAKKYALEAVNLHPTAGIYYIALAKISGDLGELQKAKKYYQKAIFFDPTNAYIRCGFATMLYDLDKLKEAKEHHQIAIDLAPKNHAFHCIMAITLLHLKEFSEAKKYALEAINLCSTDGNYYNALAQVSENLGEWQEAENYYQKAVELKPEDTGFRADLAAIQKKRNEAKTEDQKLNQ